jgi:cell division FtsZ-interacting protein ZapD
MTNEQMERAIEVLLDHHAKFSVDIGELKDVQRQQAENLNKLTADVQALTDNMGAMQSQIDSIITEMRDGFDKLILANEVSRHLAEQAIKLSIAVSQRVTGIDQRVTELEQK